VRSAAYLAAASPRLQNLIIAALESACRCGELLSLQWRDVDLERGELTIRAEKAKDGDMRVLPMSSRLKAVLKMAQTDPAGNDYPGDAFVFGELGEETANISRAWRTCVLKANGHDPIWTSTAALAPASLAALRAIDLHFHDLRHEGASRLLEAGWPLHHVQEMLGHSSIDQTTTYLNVVAAGLRASMAKSDAARCNPVASKAEIDLPLPRNETEANTEKPTVN
jgi:integrase